MNFDEIWNDDRALSSCSRDDAEDFYNEGAQSQQAKIDELQARVDSLTNINESLVAYKNQLLDELEEKGNKNEN